jgi:hypothetical protein
VAVDTPDWSVVSATLVQTGTIPHNSGTNITVLGLEAALVRVDAGPVGNFFSATVSQDGVSFSDVGVFLAGPGAPHYLPAGTRGAAGASYLIPLVGVQVLNLANNGAQDAPYVLRASPGVWPMHGWGQQPAASSAPVVLASDGPGTSANPLRVGHGPYDGQGSAAPAAGAAAIVDLAGVAGKTWVIDTVVASFLQETGGGAGTADVRFRSNGANSDWLGKLSVSVTVGDKDRIALTNLGWKGTLGLSAGAGIIQGDVGIEGMIFVGGYLV